MRPLLASRADFRRTLASSTIPITNVTAGGSANTDGSWVVLVASTTVEASELLLTFNGTGASGVDTSGLMDIYIGDGAGAPVAPIVDDWQMGYMLNASTTGIRQGHRFPIRVPAGSEIIARVRSATASRNYPVCLDLVGVTPGVVVPTFSVIRTYGAVPATSRGTQLATPAGANTKGAWTEISAAVSNTIYAVGWGPAGVWGPGFGNAEFLFDIGVGAAGSEQVVVPNLYCRTFTSEILGEEWPTGRYAPLMRPIAAGERLVARQQNTGVLSMNLIVYGYS